MSWCVDSIMLKGVRACVCLHVCDSELRVTLMFDPLAVLECLRRRDVKITKCRRPKHFYVLV